MAKMKEIIKLSEEDTYALICLLLARVKNPSYMAFGELINVLDQKNFESFITYFGGCTLKVPTIDEIRQEMRAIILYKLHAEDKYGFKTSMEKAGYSPNETTLAKQEYCIVKEKMKEANKTLLKTYDKRR